VKDNYRIGPRLLSKYETTNFAKIKHDNVTFQFYYSLKDYSGKRKLASKQSLSIWKATETGV
jgi:hypothetical protein